MYHTQEKRGCRLTSPILCKKDNAWLGVGYYFWDEEVDAVQWGNNSKRRTGCFEIYSAVINCNKVLDTVFNEEHYNFWRRQIEKAAKVITKKTGVKATPKEINLYLASRANWAQNADGVLFQDLPYSQDLLITGLNYRKRIQIAVYNKAIIQDFILHDTLECND